MLPWQPDVCIKLNYFYNFGRQSSKEHSFESLVKIYSGIWKEMIWKETLTEMPHQTSLWPIQKKIMLFACVQHTSRRTKSSLLQSSPLSTSTSNELKITTLDSCLTLTHTASQADTVCRILFIKFCAFWTKIRSA